MCGTKTESVSDCVCGCETARKKGILKDSQRNVSVCSGYETITSVAIIYVYVCVYIYDTSFCVCVCLPTHLPLSARSERCVWLGMSLPQVGFVLSSTHFLDPGSVVSSVRPFLLPVHPPVAVSFSIYWLIPTWDFLYRTGCCQGSCGWVWYHHCPRIGRSPPEISSLHLCASRVRQTHGSETLCQENI